MDLQPLFMDGLTPAMKERAITELGEVPENIEKALLEVKNLINETPDFCFYEDDTFLLKFLRVKKFNAVKSYDTLKNYYAFKKKYPGVLTDYMRTILKTGCITLSPLRTPDGSAVLIIHLGLLDLDNFSLEQYFQTAILVGEQGLENEATQVCGGHIVYDFKGITLKKIKQLADPSFLAMLVKGIENTWPIRMRSAQLVNEPFYVSIPYGIIYPLLSKKLKNRVGMNGSNLSSLHKTIPVECLPKRLGGKLDSEALAKFKETIVARQTELELSNKYSFHRIHKIGKKLSTCGLEESATSVNRRPTPPIQNVAI